MPTLNTDIQHARQLLDQLGPGQLTAVVQLLEVMLETNVEPDDDEPLSEQDRRTVLASRDHFRKDPSAGVPFDQFAAECGLTMDQIRNHRD